MALSIWRTSPIGALVHHKRIQRLLRPVGRPTLLGDGLLERVRAASLALLGATAAVGLAIVALVLNQSWPLIANSAIPQVPPRHQGLADATVVARAGRAGPLRAAVQTSSKRRRHKGVEAPDAGAVRVALPPDAEFVSPSTPVETQGPSTPSPAPQGHPPATHQPAKKPPPASAAPPPAQPEAAPAPNPGPSPVAAPAPPPPAATVSEAPPEESSVPPWSHGKGHAYGRSEGWGEAGSED